MIKVIRINSIFFANNCSGRLLTPSIVAFDKKDLLLPAGQQRKTKVGHLAEVP